MMFHTPKSRVEAALRGEPLDHPPFTVYHDMLPRGTTERDLRNQGLAIIERIDPFRIVMPNVDILTRETYADGILTRREWIRTPVGELTRTQTKDARYRTTYAEWWEAEPLVKTLDDYRVLEFALRDQVFVPEYDAIRGAQDQLGDDGFVIANAGYLPMQQLMYVYLGVERFAYEFVDHPDALLSLHEVMRQKNEELFRIAVAAPVQMFIGPGRNVDASMFGKDLFEEYCLPLMDSFADLAHGQGKLSGSHLDGRMGYLRDAIRTAHMDVVEAFTPGAMSGMTVREGFTAWPSKIIWANFPSDRQVGSPDEVHSDTLALLEEVAPGDRFLLGVTEDVPEVAWEASFGAISRALAQHAGTLSG